MADEVEIASSVDLMSVTTTMEAGVDIGALQAIALANMIVRIASRYGEIPAIVEAEDAIKRGVISMSHCFGGTDPDCPSDVREAGANTGLLSSVEHEYDPHSGIPRMSAIPVRISRGA